MEPIRRNRALVPQDNGSDENRKPRRFQVSLVNKGAQVGEGQFFLLMDAFHMGFDDAAEAASRAKLNGMQGLLVSSFEVIETKAMIAGEKRKALAAQYPELENIDFTIEPYDS